MIKPHLEKLLSKLKKSEKMPLPQITSPYNQALKKQQEALLISLIIAIAVAGFYTYFYTQAQIEAENKIAVLVAATDLAAPHEIKNNDLTTVQIAKELLPEGFFLANKKEDLVGKSLTLPLKAKQILLSSQIQSDLDPSSISAKFDESFALSMDEDWFVAKLPNLKANDRIDLVVTNPRDDLSATSVLARSLKVISISKASNKRSLVVNATEEEAKAIVFAKGLKLPMQVLVHSAIQPIEIETEEENNSIEN